MLRPLLAVLGHMLLQLSLALAIYQSGYAGYHWLAGTIRRDISFGLQLHFSLYLFSALALINAICLVGFGWRRAGLISLSVCLGLWALFWLNILLAMPYRSLLVLAAGGVALAAPWVWLRQRRCA